MLNNSYFNQTRRGISTMKFTDRLKIMQTVLTILKEAADDEENLDNNKVAILNDLLSQSKLLRKHSDTMELFEHARFSVKDRFNDKEKKFYRDYRVNFHHVFDQMIAYIVALPEVQSKKSAALLQEINGKFRSDTYLKNDFDTDFIAFKKSFSNLFTSNYALGAMVGFFKIKGLTLELGLIAGKHINRTDAANLALTSKECAENAKSYRR
jgi:hypothetical protein